MYLAPNNYYTLAGRRGVSWFTHGFQSEAITPPDQNARNKPRTTG